MRADSLAQAPEYHDRVAITDEIEALFEAMLAEDALFSLHDLPLSGNDLLTAGVPEGPIVGELLEAAFQEVVEERLEVDHDALLAFALERYRARH